MKLDTKTCSLFSKRNQLPIFHYQKMVYALKFSNEILLRDLHVSQYTRSTANEITKKQILIADDGILCLFNLDVILSDITNAVKDTAYFCSLKNYK